MGKLDEWVYGIEGKAKEDLLKSALKLYLPSDVVVYVSESMTQFGYQLTAIWPDGIHVNHKLSQFDLKKGINALDDLIKAVCQEMVWEYQKYAAQKPVGTIGIIKESDGAFWKGQTSGATGGALTYEMLEKAQAYGMGSFPPAAAKPKHKQPAVTSLAEMYAMPCTLPAATADLKHVKEPSKFYAAFDEVTKKWAEGLAGKFFVDDPMLGYLKSK